MPNQAKKPSAAAKTDKSLCVLDIGDHVPAFSMPTTCCGTVSNTALKGQNYVLYFYPKDDTSGCTAEACAFNEALPKWSKSSVTVIGVSKDSLEKHEKFAKKYNLNFPLASDADGEVCAKFGVWKQKSMYGRPYMGIERSTFLVDGTGIVRAIWRKVSVPGHVEAVQTALADI